MLGAPTKRYAPYAAVPAAASVANRRIDDPIKRGVVANQLANDGRGGAEEAEADHTEKRDHPAGDEVPRRVSCSPNVQTKADTDGHHGKRDRPEDDAHRIVHRITT